MMDSPSATRCAIVAMVQAAHDRHPNDLFPIVQSSPCWRLSDQCLVRPSGMAALLQVLFQQTLKMALVQDEDVVPQFSARRRWDDALSSASW